MGPVLAIPIPTPRSRQALPLRSCRTPQKKRIRQCVGPFDAFVRVITPPIPLRLSSTRRGNKNANMVWCPEFGTAGTITNRF